MITRRQFLQASASLALVPMLPRGVVEATSLRTRPTWPTFRNSTLYPAFLTAVRKMKANQDTTSPASWGYWVKVHGSFCPHGKPYFLAWHRGFLLRFEAQLRNASGNSALVLPYWDYYRHPVLPPEFTDPSSPLYRSDRAGTDVSRALSLAAFSGTLTNFQRGLLHAFEPAVESSPHNGVHNLIGGSMANITVSPRDPIFWLHHANIDRLWDAWVAAGAGRHMPATTSSYWYGSFGYGAGVPGMKRVATYSTGGLGYRYDNRTLPTSLPNGLQAMTAVGPATIIPAAIAQPLPPQGSFLGGAVGLALGPQSSRLRIALSPEGRNRVRSLLNAPQQAGAAAGGGLRVVLDDVAMTGAGAQGGYFYKILLNLPTTGTAQPEWTYQLGTLGPFEVSVAQHAQAMAQGGNMAAMQGPARIELPALEVLQRIWPEPLDALTLSFVRVGASQPGTALRIGRVSIEVAG